MITFIAFTAFLILFGLAMFQIALIFGAPIGQYAWGGSHTTLPRRLRIASVVSIIIYALFATVILSKAGVLNVIENQAFLNTSMWVITVYFFLGIIMNAISRSKRERNLMTPIATLLALLFLLVTVFTINT